MAIFPLRKLRTHHLYGRIATAQLTAQKLSQGLASALGLDFSSRRENVRTARVRISSEHGGKAWRGYIDKAHSI